MQSLTYNKTTNDHATLHIAYKFTVYLVFVTCNNKTLFPRLWQRLLAFVSSEHDFLCKLAIAVYTEFEKKEREQKSLYIELYESVVIGLMGEPRAVNWLLYALPSN